MDFFPNSLYGSFYVEDDKSQVQIGAVFCFFHFPVPIDFSKCCICALTLWTNFQVVNYLFNASKFDLKLVDLLVF